MGQRKEKDILNNYDAIILDFDGVVCDSVKIKEEAFYNCLKVLYPEIHDIIRLNQIELAGSRFQRADEILRISKNNNLLFDRIRYLQTYSHIVRKEILKTRWSKSFLESKWKDSHVYIVSLGFEEEVKSLITDKKQKEDIFLGGNIYGSPRLKLENTRMVLSKYPTKKVLSIGDSYTDFRIAQETEIDFLYVKAWSSISNRATFKKLELPTNNYIGSIDFLDELYN